MELIKLNPESCSEWDDYFNSSFEGNICQTFYWTKTLADLDNATPLFYKLQHNGNDISYFIFFIKRPWKRSNNPNANIINKIRRKRWIEWMDGPIFLTEDIDLIKNGLRMYLQEVERIMLENKIKNVTYAAFANNSRLCNFDEIKEIFLDYGYSYRTWATYLTDLTVDEDDLFLKLKKSARKSIKRCLKSQVTVKMIDTYDQYLKYISFYDQEKNSSSKFTPSREWFEETIKNNYSFWYAIDENGVCCATLGIYIYNGIATEIMSLLPEYAFKNKIYAQDLLHWEIFKYAKSVGCHTFNIAGVNPSPKSQKEKGIKQFKEKFGGEYGEFFIYNIDENNNIIYKILTKLFLRLKEQ